MEAENVIAMNTRPIQQSLNNSWTTNAFDFFYFNENNNTIFNNIPGSLLLNSYPLLALQQKWATNGYVMIPIPLASM